METALFLVLVALSISLLMLGFWLVLLWVRCARALTRAAERYLARTAPPDRPVPHAPTAPSYPRTDKPDAPAYPLTKRPTR